MIASLAHRRTSGGWQSAELGARRGEECPRSHPYPRAALAPLAQFRAPGPHVQLTSVELVGDLLLLRERAFQRLPVMTACFPTRRKLRHDRDDGKMKATRVSARNKVGGVAPAPGPRIPKWMGYGLPGSLGRSLPRRTSRQTKGLNAPDRSSMVCGGPIQKWMARHSSTPPRPRACSWRD